MEVPLKVRYGTIYTKNGIGIDNMAVILDKEVVPKPIHRWRNNGILDMPVRVRVA